MRLSGLPLAITLLLSACSTERPPVGAVTVEAEPLRSASASAAPAAAAAPPARPSCPQLSKQAVAHGTELIAASLAAARKAGASNVEHPTDPPAFIGKCFPTPTGAWVVTMAAAKYDAGYSGVENRWSLEHVSEGGARVSVVPTMKDDSPKADEFNYASSPETYEIEMAAHDYDGDGVPELIMQISGRYHEGEAFASGRIYTLKRGAIARYAPAKGLDFEAARDVDGDGRPDLVVYGPYSSVAESCGSGFSYRVAGPQLLAHARPDGTFSLNDDVAQQAARKECPEKPARIVPKGSGADTRVSAHNVACARIWGASAADVQKRIAAECKRAKSSDMCPPNDCYEADLLKRWAAAEPPLVLK